jgi:predicted aspartyl protease
MGTLRTEIEIENPAIPGDRRRVESLLVDTGSALTWIQAPLLESLGIARVKRLRFRQATGQVIERWVGDARIFAAGTQTLDDVVFGERGDLSLLGARTLEGLNVVVDPVSRRLVDAGAMPAAAETREISENAYIDLDASGNLVSMTIEHAATVAKNWRGIKTPDSSARP